MYCVAIYIINNIYYIILFGMCCDVVEFANTHT